MNSTRNPMLPLIDIARREEGRCALGVSEVAKASVAILGGRASRDEPGTWANGAWGIGLDPAIVAERDEAGVRAEVQQLIEWFSDAGIEPRVELCPFADSKVIRALAEAGFVARQFEHVFFRELAGDEPFEAPVAPPPGLELRIVDPSDASAVATFARVVNEGFARSNPAAEPPTIRDVDLDLFSRCVRHHRTTALGAWLEGQCVAGGAMERLDDVAALYGLSVLPEFRRRGIQQALISARLRLAAEGGARLATIGGPPGMSTERNVRRFGFVVAYTKVILVRPGPGLVSAA